MSTLDQPHVTDEQSASYWPAVQRFGLLGALVLIAFTLVSLLMGLGDPTNTSGFLGILIFLVSAVLYIGIGGLAIRYHRDQDLGGFVYFGRAFRVAFLSILIAAILAALFQLLYTTVIDSGYYDEMMNKTIAVWEEQGMTEEQIETALSFSKFFLTPFGALIAGLGGALFFSALFGVISAAIFKRTPPQTA